MKITATEEEIKDFLEDGTATIDIGDFHLYLETDRDGLMWYTELIKSKNGKTQQGYAFNITDFERLKPKRPYDPSYYHNDPLCPNCQTYMIYHFEHCPKCGQKLDWSEK